MFSPSNPGSSPLAHLGSKSSYQRQLFQPSHSSPLSASSSSPTCKAQTRRKRQYKSQDSSRSSFPSTNLLDVLEDTPQKQFLREKFKARCLERAKGERALAVRKAREASYANGSSSDGFEIDDDVSMDDEDGDGLNDELYRRVMMNEERRAEHAKRVSFERDFGSSIDPNMHEDMASLEWELTGQRPEPCDPPSDDLDDELIQEYLSELEEIEWQEKQRKAARLAIGSIDINTEDPSELEHEFTAEKSAGYPSPPRSMYSDLAMASPPSSPSRPEAAFAHLQGLTSTRNCPLCGTSASCSEIACTACVAQYSLGHARSVWFDAESHPGVEDSDHVPLATMTPNESGVGLLMLCGAPGCDWCYAF